MSKEKVLKFVSKYKMPLAIAFGLSIISYLNPAEYKGEYIAKAEAIEKINSEIVDIEKTDKTDEITKEAEKVENKNNELKNILGEKKVEFEKIREEKEAKEKEAMEKEAEAKKKAEEVKKKQEEAKKKEDEQKNNTTTAKGNNGNSSGGTTTQTPKPVEKPVQKPANQGIVVYANGGSSKSNKYHSSPTAHKMEGAIKMSESDAKAKGYVACKNCY